MRWFLPSIVLLAACGGQSSGESRSRGTGAGSTESAGDSSIGAGSGGSGSGPAMSGGSAGMGGSAGHVNRNERVACFDWSEVTNQPKPGETGILACPDYTDIDWIASQGNCVAKADRAPVPPEPGGDTGDCCYHYTYYECR